MTSAPPPPRALRKKLKERLTLLVLALTAAGLVFGVPGLRRSPSTAPLRPAAHRQPMADLTLPTLAGPAWTLSRHRGHVVLLNFWATWCPPCREETPALVRIARDYRAAGLDVAGVALDQDSMNSVPPFVASSHIPYPVLLAGPSSPAAGAVQALPTTFLIDRQGRIAGITVGTLEEASFRRELERLLREPEDGKTTASENMSASIADVAGGAE